MTPTPRQLVLWVLPLLLLVQQGNGQVSLADGRFETTTDVTSWLNLAIDAAAIRDAEDVSVEKDIYANGQNAVYTEGGTEMKRTLAGLSLNSYPLMAQDGLYNVFRHTFLLIGSAIEGETLGNFDQKPVQEYANTLVNDLFALNVEHIETEAAIILNVWMAIVHFLYDVLRGCRAQDATAMNKALDQAAALWVGADQPLGANDRGNMLYNLAQIGGQRFNQANGEALANTKVLDGMNDIQQKIAGGTCSSGEQGYLEMRYTINKLFGSMTIPLVQILIHHIQQQPRDGGANFIELYALSFLPRVEACNPDVYEKLLELLVRNTLKEADKATAIGLLQSVYDCVDVTCEDIGSYESGEVPTCSDDEVQVEALAGYSPTTDVHPYSFLDRDILSIRKMTHMQAYEAAMDYYMYGFHARRSDTDYLTLHDLAISPDRSGVTNQFGVYTGYFGSDNYADEIIANVLTSIAPFDQASGEQRAELVAGYLNEMVMYMAVLQKLYQAAQSCESDKGQSQQSLDQAVAYYVGSMEGSAAGGLAGGQLLYATSKSLCDDFSKCVEGANSEVNQKLIAAFSAMIVSIQLSACAEVQTALSDIETLLPVPLIQGSLHYADVNSKLSQGAADASLGTADPFASSMAPFIANVNSDDAAKLLANLQFRPDLKPVADGPDAVFGIYRAHLPQLALDIDCESIGQHATYGSVCPGGASAPTAPSGTSPNSPPADESTPTAAPGTPPPSDGTLGFGRYAFTSDVSLANLALDVRDMRNGNDISAATSTYTNGANAPVSLSSLSLDASSLMPQDLDFNLFRFALSSEEEFGDGSYEDASTYADVAVQKALGTAEDKDLAAEASVILHIRMFIAHYLYESVRACKDGGKATESLDKAVAIWLGEGQAQGSDDVGFLMYSITEKAATRFGHEGASVDADAEAPVNTKLFEAFNEARAIAVDCPASPNLFLDLRGVAADISKSMALPLVQNLIYYMAKAGKAAPDYLKMENYVELYALSVVPHLIGCSPTSFFFLQDKLIDNDFDNSLIDAEMTSHMKTLQKCFDIKCSDLLAGEKITDAELGQLVLKLCVEDVNGPPSVVGYQPATDVTEYLKFDRDIVQIGILAETQAFTSAIDMYVNGYNSRIGKRAVSLRSLATDPGRAIVPDLFQQFSSYYGSDDFADKTIVSALRQEGQFAGANPAQRRETTIRMLQGAVSYMSLLTQLYTAVDKCKAGEDARSWWDKGVALFVGSIEGEIRGGDPNVYGEMLYSLGKEACEDFGTCEGSGDASSNEDLMNSFTSGLALLADKSCDSAAKMIKTDIMPALLISMVQGTLDYGDQMEDLSAGTTDDALATGYALSRSILPQVNDSNPTSAGTIDSNMDFQLSSDPVPDGTETLFDAIAYAISGMNVDCKKIGSLDGLTVCSEDLRPHQSTPTEMGDGMYTTTTYVQDRANIALDVLAMKNTLSDGNPDLAEAIYADGENSEIYDKNGIKIGARSLKSFSTNAPTEMADEPWFNIFRYALQDEQGQFLGQDAGLYADSLMTEAFANTNPSSQTIAAEAVLVYNLWMYLVHELYQTLRQCKNKAIVDTDGIHSIDEAVAYWIGDGQVTGEAEQGHLLYALAEQMGEKFGLDETGQSRTNTNVLRLFNQAKLELSLPTACSDNPDTFPRLSQIVNRIVSWMTVPLMQGLISNLRENDKDRVKMYARAVVPMVAGCSESTFAYLNEKLLAGEEYNVVEVDDIIASLQTTYECLGFTCDDVGVHELDSSQSCSDPAVLSPLAGYIPQSDVRSFALLDLDILHANILMEMGAYGAVEDLYTRGKHALVEDENGLQTLSLYQMATTSQRSVVPQYDSFIRYYESDKYADDIIRKALDPNDEKFSQASDEQRREVVVKTMQYLVVYMASLQEMYQAIADCGDPDAGKILDAAEAWDRAAAFLIGSLEGPADGGNEEGLSFYRLALKRCEQFGTCAPEGRPSWNDEFNSLLYTGRASVQGRACGELRKTVREIETLLRVPLIQGTLRYALANVQLPQNSEDKGLGEGYAFSRSVLPLVEDSNRDSANTIAENMDLQFERVPVHDGVGAVFSAFARAYGNMNVNCEDVGKAGSYDACSGATSPGGPNETNVGMIVGIVVGVLALVAIAVFLVLFERKKKKKAAEGEPSFVRSTRGELNHTSDRMSGDAYTKGESADDDDYDAEYGEQDPDMAVLVEPSPEKTAPLDDDSFTID